MKKLLLLIAVIFIVNVFGQTNKSNNTMSYLYILTVRKNVDGDTHIMTNLGVFNTLQSAVNFVINQTKNNNRPQYFLNGILKFHNADELGAYFQGELGNNVLLYSNDDYKVVAEKSELR